MKNNFMFLFIILLSVIMMNWGFKYTDIKDAFSSIVKDMGYNAEEKPMEIVRFTIPNEFDKVYERYNNLLKKGGFDLEEYKGKECVRYTYYIKKDDLVANIIVYNGKIIGGDISSHKIDGMMLPIKKNDKLIEEGFYAN